MGISLHVKVENLDIGGAIIFCSFSMLVKTAELACSEITTPTAELGIINHGIQRIVIRLSDRARLKVMWLFAIESTVVTSMREISCVLQPGTAIEQLIDELKNFFVVMWIRTNNLWANDTLSCRFLSPGKKS